MAITYHAGRRIQGTPAEYKVHSFTSGGTFAVTGSGDVEYLVIAGGGGGSSGGAGAGGYLTNLGGTAVGVTAQSYPITVGTGGTGVDGGGSTAGNNGTNSVFSSITSIGGGGGGGVTSGDDGGNGGSGGGAGANNNSSVTFGTGTAGQGYNGGAASATSSPFSSGGGGGSSQVGYNNNGSTVAGNGGDGTASSITGSSVTRAGGGGGTLYGSSGTVGIGGSGGGGSGSGTVGGNGTANTGSGGGGGRNSQNGGTGGSGIVIIRYLTSSGITATGGTITTTSEAETKPTNVQVGSRFEETDTRKMYHYNPQTATVDDDLTTDKGWVSNTGTWTYNATGDYIDFATITRSQTAQQIYIDVQDSDYLGSGNNLSDSSWVARFKVRTGTKSSTQGGVSLYLGFSNNLADSGTTQQSATLTMNFNGWSNENNMQLAVSRANFETTGSPARVNSDVYANTNLPYSTDVYMEMIRNGDVFTLKAYSDEYVTQASSTSVASATVTGISTLRYIKAFTDSEQNQSYTSGGARLYDMKIYNGVTTIPTGNAWTEEGT
tara:strand:- start:22 stop:1662 length:1641 start_codon:yes stop_codon:yes gene_type:complete